MIIRSSIKSRRINVGKENERVPNDPQYFSFWLDKFTDKPSKPHSIIVDAPAKLVCHSDVVTSSGNPLANSNKVAPPLDGKMHEVTDVIDVQVADLHDPTCDEMDNIVDFLP